MHLPTYADALKLKNYLSERNLSYVHFHDQCGSTFFSFDEYDEATVNAVFEYYAPMGLKPSFSEDKLRFIVTEVNHE